MATQGVPISGAAPPQVAVSRPPSFWTPELDLLQELANRDEELQRLRTKLAELDDSPAYDEAKAMGVVALVRETHLPDRQQRRLAVTIVREARSNGLDPLLVLAVIRCESGFDAFAVSPVGAMGLMQVMPSTGGWLLSRRGLDLHRKHNLFDVELNVELGSAYLAELIVKFGTIERALVAYNAGPSAAFRILSQAPTRQRFLAGYPAKVMGEYRRLKAQYEEARANRLLAEARARDLPCAGENRAAFQARCTPRNGWTRNTRNYYGPLMPNFDQGQGTPSGDGYFRKERGGMDPAVPAHKSLELTIPP